jgi:hypothetical protein
MRLNQPLLIVMLSIKMVSSLRSCRIFGRQTMRTLSSTTLKTTLGDIPNASVDLQAGEETDLVYNEFSKLGLTADIVKGLASQGL